MSKHTFKKMEGNPAFKHGISAKNRRLYTIWKHMMQRCYLQSCKGYNNYGGRGIGVAQDWHNVSIFYDWAIANGYQSNLTIERNNVNGDYEPSNCKWILRSEQNKNKRNCLGSDAAREIKKRLANGDRQIDIAKDFGLPKQRIWRIKAGWDYKNIAVCLLCLITVSAKSQPDTLCFPVPVIQKVLIAAEQKKVLEERVLILNERITGFEQMITVYKDRDSVTVSSYEAQIKVMREQRVIWEAQISNLNKQLKREKRKRFWLGVGMVTSIAGGTFLYLTK